jgi:hypothetical protein
MRLLAHFSTLDGLLFPLCTNDPTKYRCNISVHATNHSDQVRIQYFIQICIREDT